MERYSNYRFILFHDIKLTFTLHILFLEIDRLNNSSRFYETIPRAVRTVAANRPDANSSSELVNNVKNRVPRTVCTAITPYLYSHIYVDQVFSCLNYVLVWDPNPTNWCLLLILLYLAYLLRDERRSPTPNYPYQAVQHTILMGPR